MTYPIAEIFHSVQGEGVWTGVPMLFIRLAGCHVGRYGTTGVTMTSEVGTEDFHLLMENKHSICTTFDGQRFLCDTDYHKSEKMELVDIAAKWTTEKHICITGGEPLLHDLKPLIDEMRSLDSEMMIHVETSGTLPISEEVYNVAWITCCPKHIEGEPLWSGIFDVANEWKILVGQHFNEPEFLGLLEQIQDAETDALIFFQPINGVHTLWQSNLKFCLDLLHAYPSCRLSAQLHKYLEVR